MGASIVILVSLALGLGFQLGAHAQEFQLIPPTRDRSGAILQSQTGRAYLQTSSAGKKRRLPVRRDELLSTLAEVDGGWIAAGASTHRNDLVVISIAGSSIERLDTPPGRGSDFRLRPRVLNNEGAGPALAWLEGPDLKSLSIRISNLLPSGWTEIASMPRRLRGGQTGLSVAPLADGSYLLVWAEFDGSDDDLMYARLIGQTVTPPKRVGPDNQVPDVMPSVIDVPGGALLAWSQLDNGDYRIKIRRFEGTSWGSARTHGPPGALRPELRLQGNALHLLYREAWPRRWAVEEIRPSGRAERRASVALESLHPPVVESVDNENVVLRWSVADSYSATWRQIR